MIDHITDAMLGTESTGWNCGSLTYYIIISFRRNSPINHLITIKPNEGIMSVIRWQIYSPFAVVLRSTPTTQRNMTFKLAADTEHHRGQVSQRSRQANINLLKRVRGVWMKETIKLFG